MPKGITLISLIVAGIIFSTTVLPYLARLGEPQANIASAISAVSDAGLPLRLTIPKISVNADIEYVGLTPDGAMDVPKGPEGAAWYDLGMRPGEIGSAVIAGHSGWKNGIPAVFDNLYKLQVGDKIYVEDDTGVTTSFIVRAIRIYDPEADASDVFGSSDGKAHLNLITCEGIWDPVTKSSSERLVVFTDKENR